MFFTIGWIGLFVFHLLNQLAICAIPLRVVTMKVNQMTPTKPVVVLMIPQKEPLYHRRSHVYRRKHKGFQFYRGPRAENDTKFQLRFRPTKPTQEVVASKIKTHLKKMADTQKEVRLLREEQVNLKMTPKIKKPHSASYEFVNLRDGQKRVKIKKRKSNRRRVPEEKNVTNNSKMINSVKGIQLYFKPGDQIREDLKRRRHKKSRRHERNVTSSGAMRKQKRFKESKVHSHSPETAKKHKEINAKTTQKGEDTVDKEILHASAEKTDIVQNVAQSTPRAAKKETIHKLVLH